MSTNKVYVETCNFNMFTVEINKFRGHNDIVEFLKMLNKNLEHDDAFSLYSVCFDGAKRYKLTLISDYDELDEKSKTRYIFELVDHSEGEEIIEVIYKGTSQGRIKHLIWDNRTIINQGLDGLC